MSPVGERARKRRMSRTGVYGKRDATSEELLDHVGSMSDNISKMVDVLSFSSPKSSEPSATGYVPLCMDDIDASVKRNIDAELEASKERTRDDIKKQVAEALEETNETLSKMKEMLSSVVFRL